MSGDLILVTGANGYIAGRLIPRLLARGCRVRALARRPERLEGRLWRKDVEVMRADVHQPDGLAAALAGVHTAYYLVHSMASGRGYTRVELEAARLFAAEAERAGVRHIIYLGGLADPNSKNLAPHMRSRIETGETLRAGRVPVTEFRAGVIVGPGSISFEMIRFLTECFPIMPGPNWLRNRAQPVAAVNVIDYLLAALDHPEERGRIHEMGGPETMCYADTMLGYASVRGLKRFLFTLPGIPIWLMARFVDWLTPVPYPIATPLVGGLQSDSVVMNADAHMSYPEVRLVSYRQAVSDSLQALRPERLERVWEGMDLDCIRMKHEGFFIDYRRLQVDAPDEVVYRVFSSLGGRSGWLYANWLWRLRGWLDRLLTSPALHGRRPPLGAVDAADSPAASEPRLLHAGDRVDYYRVDEVEPNHMLRLHSLLHAPGEGWMEWRIEGSVLSQTAFFAPHGLPGFAYWMMLSPLHRIVFRGLIGAIKKRSEGR
ncbi:MAG TPA: DUF2867 domain-containing protein [Anaerolineales bacterium]|nr:DUF2867 domain-containing protein [Anaerolineales bacterium]